MSQLSYIFVNITLKCNNDRPQLRHFQDGYEVVQVKVFLLKS